LFPLVFGAQFAAAAHLMWPLMAACVIAGPMSMGYGPLLNAKLATSALALSATAGAATNVLLNILLIPRWGLLGCAWATVGSYLVGLSSAAYLLWRWRRLNGGQAFETVLPLVGGAALAGVTGNSWMAFWVTSAVILCLAIFRREALLIGGRRLFRIWARQYEMAL
jgi:O-antigen/teichoic acid export membrane protein